MTDVAATMDRMYGREMTADLPRDARHAWFGHPARLTVRGESVSGD